MKEYFSARSLEARVDNAAPPDHDAVHLKPFFTYPEDRENSGLGCEGRVLR